LKKKRSKLANPVELRSLAGVSTGLGFGLLRGKSSPGVKPNPPFGPILDSTDGVRGGLRSVHEGAVGVGLVSRDEARGVGQ